MRMEIYENGWHDFCVGSQGHKGRDEPALDATLDALEKSVKFLFFGEAPERRPWARQGEDRPALFCRRSSWQLKAEESAEPDGKQSEKVEEENRGPLHGLPAGLLRVSRTPFCLPPANPRPTHHARFRRARAIGLTGSGMVRYPSAKRILSNDWIVHRWLIMFPH